MNELKTEVINMFRDSPWPGSILSNFANTPFEIDGVICSCSEAFIQSLKCENREEQIEFCAMSGPEAWEKGSKKSNRVFEKDCIWWLGKAYVLHSAEHFNLVERGLRAKFTQSSIAREALLASNEAKLIHDYGQVPGKRQTLPADKFCEIVTRIRSEIIHY